MNRLGTTDDRRTRGPWRTSLTHLAAVAAVTFYAVTAHHTRGHEADFGKQWLAARLVVTGQGRQLYDLDRQRAEMRKHYSERIIDLLWVPGIGIPTYPPVQALLYAPLGALSPSRAQWVVVQISLLAVVLTGLCVRRMTAGAISCSAVVLAILLLPAFLFTVGLGQNSAVSLAIVAGGWSLLGTGRGFWAGALWGLLVYKPPWLLAVAWVPAVVARPRAYVGLALTSAVLITATLPFCGVESWIAWVELGERIESGYGSLPKWIWYRRDLTGLVRHTVSDDHAVLLGGIGIAGIVLVTTWTWRRGSGQFQTAGARAAAVVSAVVLTCPRFMFYDITLAALPSFLALSDWKQLGRLSRACLVGMLAAIWGGPLLGYGTWPWFWPVETAGLVGLWIWSVLHSRCPLWKGPQALPVSKRD